MDRIAGFDAFRHRLHSQGHRLRELYKLTFSKDHTWNLLQNAQSSASRRGVRRVWILRNSSQFTGKLKKKTITLLLKKSLSGRRVVWYFSGRVFSCYQIFLPLSSCVLVTLSSKRSGFGALRARSLVVLVEQREACDGQHVRFIDISNIPKFRSSGLVWTGSCPIVAEEGNLAENRGFYIIFSTSIFPHAFPHWVTRNSATINLIYTRLFHMFIYPQTEAKAEPIRATYSALTSPFISRIEERSIIIPILLLVPRGHREKYKTRSRYSKVVPSPLKPCLRRWLRSYHAQKCSRIQTSPRDLHCAFMNFTILLIAWASKLVEDLISSSWFCCQVLVSLSSINLDYYRFPSIISYSRVWRKMR